MTSHILDIVRHVHASDPPATGDIGAAATTTPDCFPEEHSTARVHGVVQQRAAQLDEALEQRRLRRRDHDAPWPVVDDGDEARRTGGGDGDVVGSVGDVGHGPLAAWWAL